MIIIPTRNQIYSNEAAAILSEISMYPGILADQLYRLHPKKEEQIQNLLTYFIKQERIQKDEFGSLYSSGCSPKTARDVMIRSVWVLLDFLSETEYHCASDYPVVIVFFAGGKEYQIIYAAEGYEAIIGAAINQQTNNVARRIILVDNIGQIPDLILPGITAYCTVDANGHIEYYKSQKLEDNYDET